VSILFKALCIIGKTPGKICVFINSNWRLGTRQLPRNEPGTTWRNALTLSFG